MADISSEPKIRVTQQQTRLLQEAEAKQLQNRDSLALEARKNEEGHLNGTLRVSGSLL